MSNDYTTAIMLGEPLSEEQLDQLEDSAWDLIQACRAKDYDSAYIIASTSFNPAMLAMYVAEMCGDDGDCD